MRLVIQMRSCLCSTEIFHAMDLARINNTDSWLKRFLIHNDGNQEEALAMLWNVCEWRKSFGVNGNCNKITNCFLYVILIFLY